MELPSDRPRESAGKPNVRNPMSLKTEVIAMSPTNIANVREVRTTSSYARGCVHHAGRGSVVVAVSRGGAPHGG